MTTSTDAILFYGYCWQDEDCDRPWMIDRDGDPDDQEEDWQERYAEAMGMELIPGYHARQWDRIQTLVRASGCEVGTHCSSECPMPYVAVSDSIVMSHRGEMTEVRSLSVDPAWDGQLTEFCRVMGIPTSRARAAWWLVSDWS